MQTDCKDCHYLKIGCNMHWADCPCHDCLVKMTCEITCDVYSYAATKYFTKIRIPELNTWANRGYKYRPRKTTLWGKEIPHE